MIFNMVGKGGGGSLLISDTLDANGGIIRTITATKTVKLQTKTITPTSSIQVVDPDTGYDGFSQVTVEAGGGTTPTGNINITQAGVTDVTNYATATVPSADPFTSLTGSQFITENNQRKWTINAITEVNVEDGDVEGWLPDGFSRTSTYKTNAVPSNTSITPTESSQTVGGTNYMMEGAVTVNAIPSNYVGSGITQRSSSDLTVSGATVTAPSGYYSSSASKSVANCSLGNPTTIISKTALDYDIDISFPSFSAGYISTSPTATVSLDIEDKSVSPSTSQQVITPTDTDCYLNSVTVSAMPSGSATPASSISATGATVSTGTNTLTLSKSVSNTPQVSAGYVSSGTAGNSSVSLTANITTKAAATYHPSLTDQAISASQYLTGAQTIKAVTITNLTAANIKKDVVVKIGDSTDDDCVTTITGTYEGGSGSDVQVASANLYSVSTSALLFTGLQGEPTSFIALCGYTLAPSTTPQVVAVVYDGTNLHAQTITNTSNAQVSYASTGFSYFYNSGALTVESTGSAVFDASAIDTYGLFYTYDGTSDNIHTADVQVGSGATSITFTGLEDEPLYWSCIFKSNFSTSSGYQRVITTTEYGGTVLGYEMDSSAHPAQHWTSSYSGGSLTISSNGTNQGGYFHQPGYYQLTYAVEGSSGNYQSKTVYATSSQQVITADSAYDALKQVTIPAVTTTNLSASNIVSGVTIQVGDAADSDRIASVTGNVVLQNYYTGSSAPSSSTGSNGDLYLQT